MGFQTQVGFDTGFGVVGELAFDGPRRAMPGVLNSANPANNVVGRYFTRQADGTFRAGGQGAEGGILANPKVYAGAGTAAGGTLAQTLTLRNGEVGEFVSMGEIVVSIPGAAVQGDEPHYDPDTGIVYSAAASGLLTIPNSMIARYRQASSSGGLAVLRLTN